MGRSRESEVRERRADLLSLSSDMLSMRNDEAAVILMLRLFLIFGNAERALGVPKVTGHRFEFGVPDGRIDLLLFHADGGVTIVEAKSESCSLRELVAGIGQLHLYAAGLPKALSSRQQPKYIRLVLCAPQLVARGDRVLAACAAAGVGYASLVPFSDFRTAAGRLKVAA